MEEGGEGERARGVYPNHTSSVRRSSLLGWGNPLSVTNGWTCSAFSCTPSMSEVGIVVSDNREPSTDSFSKYEPSDVDAELIS